MGLKILYVGATGPGETSRERMLALRELGHAVQTIDTGKAIGILGRGLMKAARSVGRTPDLSGLNREILTQTKLQPFDLLWVDKGTSVRADTLRLVKKDNPGCRLVHLNPDDPFGKFSKGWTVFLEAIPAYDVHFVSRAPNVDEYRTHGGTNIFPYDRSFSKRLHRPIMLSPEERKAYGAEVGFIGSHAPARAAMIAKLIESGIPVAVHGNEWVNQGSWHTIQPCFRGPGRVEEEYVKTINGMDIALHFLRRENRDEQDSRTYEIPACGAFMIAERSPKHEQLFRENVEAVFFDTDDELLEKVRYYLVRPEQRRSIAEAGRRRCLESGYDHQSRLASLIGIVNSLS